MAFTHLTGGSEGKTWEMPIPNAKKFVQHVPEFKIYFEGKLERRAYRLAVKWHYGRRFGFTGR